MNLLAWIIETLAGVAAEERKGEERRLIRDGVSATGEHNQSVGTKWRRSRLWLYRDEA